MPHDDSLPRLKAGKLPPEFLERLLARAPVTDPRVLIGPRVGSDAALIDYGDRVLIAKTDPITFATDLIGWYAVNVNANDVACMGGAPRWFLATLLLPEGSPPSLPEAIFGQIAEACRGLGVSLVGGHTEVTYDLPRPVVVGCMLGEAPAGRQVDPSRARPGDVILLTKGIAIEGTSLLAREAPSRLAQAGMSQEAVAACRDLLMSPGISVMRDAQVTCNNVTPHALHDPTEGGLATALHELSKVARLGLRVHRERIPVLPATQAVCDALGLDPLGLLASGALLIAVGAGEAARVQEALREAGTPAHTIGELRPVEEGVRMVDGGREGPLPVFERDELARFLAP